jgi:hypothetical protein
MPFPAWNQIICGDNSIMRLDAWLGVFGDKDTNDQDIEEFTPCDPKECTSDSGVCVDCTKCTDHCACNHANAAKTPPPSPSMAAKQPLTPSNSSSDNENQIEHAYVSKDLS